MTKKGLGYINALMASLNVPYAFGEYKSEPIPETYWTGEYIESDTLSEDGRDESTFIITGTTKGSMIGLETVKELIRKKTKNGLTAILEGNSGIAVSYSNSTPTPSVEFGVHKLQINLTVTEWSVDNE